MRASFRNTLARAALLAGLCACGRDPAPPKPPDATAVPPPQQVAPPAPTAAPASATPADPGDEPPRGRNGAVELDPPEIDLKVVDPGETRTLEIRVRNISSAPLRIDGVGSSCGHCIAIEYDRREFAPGADAKVTVKVTALTSNAHEAFVTIHTSDPRHQGVLFVIRYAVVPDVTFRPPKIDLGKARIGETVERTAELLVHVPEGIEDPVLTAAVVGEAPLRLTLDPATVSAAPSGFRDVRALLHLALDTARPLAPFDVAIAVDSSRPRTLRRSQVRVLGEVRPGSYFEHTSLSFGTVPVGESKRLTIRFYYDSPAPPDPIVVELAPAGFREEHAVEAERHCIRFDVTCTPPAAGALAGTLTLRPGGDAAAETLKLIARGR